MTVPLPTKSPVKNPDLVVVAVIPLPYMKKRLKTFDIDYGTTIRRVNLERMDRPILVEIPTNVKVPKG